MIAFYLAEEYCNYSKIVESCVKELVKNTHFCHIGREGFVFLDKLYESEIKFLNHTEYCFTQSTCVVSNFVKLCECVHA